MAMFITLMFLCAKLVVSQKEECDLENAEQCALTYRSQYNTTVTEHITQGVHIITKHATDLCASIIKDSKTTKCYHDNIKLCAETESKVLSIQWKETLANVTSFCTSLCRDLQNLTQCNAQIYENGIQDGQFERFCITYNDSVECASKVLQVPCLFNITFYKSLMSAPARSYYSRMCTSGCSNLDETIPAINSCWLHYRDKSKTICQRHMNFKTCLYSKADACPEIEKLLPSSLYSYLEMTCTTTIPQTHTTPVSETSMEHTSGAGINDVITTVVSAKTSTMRGSEKSTEQTSEADSKNVITTVISEKSSTIRESETSIDQTSGTDTTNAIPTEKSSTTRGSETSMVQTSGADNNNVITTVISEKSTTIRESETSIDQTLETDPKNAKPTEKSSTTKGSETSMVQTSGADNNSVITTVISEKSSTIRESETSIDQSSGTDTKNAKPTEKSSTTKGSETSVVKTSGADNNSVITTVISQKSSKTRGSRTRSVQKSAADTNNVITTDSMHVTANKAYEKVVQSCVLSPNNLPVSPNDMLTFKTCMSMMSMYICLSKNMTSLQDIYLLNSFLPKHITDILENGIYQRCNNIINSYSAYVQKMASRCGKPLHTGCTGTGYGVLGCTTDTAHSYSAAASLHFVVFILSQILTYF